MLSPIESARLLDIKARDIKLCLQSFVGVVDRPIPDLNNMFRMVVAYEKKFRSIHVSFDQMKKNGYCLPGCLTKDEALIGRDNLGPQYKLYVNSSALSMAMKLNVRRKNGVLIPV